MIIQKKIAAFTILEAIITLVLTTLLVAFSFGVYSNFNKGIYLFDTSTTRLTELLLFKNAVNSDWFNAVNPKGNESYLELYNERQKQFISYEILENSVIRKSTVNDTFQMVIKNIELVYLDKQNEIIEKISIEFEKNRQLYKVALHKDYDLKTRMKYSVD